MTVLVTLLAQAVSLAATNYTVDVPMRAPPHRPEWADEFTRSIDRTRWRFDTDRNREGTLMAVRSRRLYSVQSKQVLTITFPSLFGSTVAMAKRQFLQFHFHCIF